MNIERTKLIVSGLHVEVVRKDIKNLHLGVYPPHGRVRVAVPRRVSDDAVRLAVIGKLAWINRQRARFEAQQRQSEREMLSGETHYFLGQRYRLQVIPDGRAARVLLRGKSTIEMRLRPGMGAQQRELVLQRWYREQLKELIPPFLEKWQPVLGLELVEWRIKRMRTRWGTCNAKARRVWLNLELAKKSEQCLEYVIVHELAHLIARKHDDSFVAVMDKHLPQWRIRRQELNSAPLAHETWSY